MESAIRTVGLTLLIIFQILGSCYPLQLLFHCYKSAKNPAQAHWCNEGFSNDASTLHPSPPNLYPISASFIKCTLCVPYNTMKSPPQWNASKGSLNSPCTFQSTLLVTILTSFSRCYLWQKQHTWRSLSTNKQKKPQVLSALAAWLRFQHVRKDTTSVY